MTIRYGQQDIRPDDIDAVVDVLKSLNLTQGPNIPKFEQAVLAHTGARHAIAVNSATSALHIACLALDLSTSIPARTIFARRHWRKSSSRPKRPAAFPRSSCPYT
jgi:dTDP-4-amino-4,6-dideoxygalactose transaminase